jgi:hypothetical protein
VKTYLTPSRLLTVAAVAFANFALPSLRASGETLIDFTYFPREPSGREVRPFEYAWGDWNNHVNNLRGKGTVIKSASGNGGIGENNPGADFEDAKVLELHFVIGSGNQARLLSFYLEDKDGTQVAWNIPLTDKPAGREIRQTFDLERPDYTQNAGAKPGLNLKKIKVWQIRGDNSPPGVEILLIKLSRVQ